MLPRIYVYIYISLSLSVLPYLVQERPLALYEKGNDISYQSALP